MDSKKVKNAEIVMVSLSNHHYKSIAYIALRQAQGDKERLFANASRKILIIMKISSIQYSTFIGAYGNGKP